MQQAAFAIAIERRTRALERRVDGGALSCELPTARTIVLAKDPAAGHSLTGPMELDPAAVIRSYAPFVWRVLRHQGVPSAQLEDSSQEVFLLIFRRLAEFEGRSSLSTWVYGVCRNVARESRRRRSRRPDESAGDPPDVALAAPQPEALERKRVWACVQATLAILPESTRMTFVLFELEGMNIEEIAELLNTNSSTAYSRLYAARARVRRALEQAGLVERDQDIAEVV